MDAQVILAQVSGSIQCRYPAIFLHNYLNPMDYLMTTCADSSEIPVQPGQDNLVQHCEYLSRKQLSLFSTPLYTNSIHCQNLQKNTTSSLRKHLLCWNQKKYLSFIYLKFALQRCCNMRKQSVEWRNNQKSERLGNENGVIITKEIILEDICRWFIFFFFLFFFLSPLIWYTSVRQRFVRFHHKALIYLTQYTLVADADFLLCQQLHIFGFRSVAHFFVFVIDRPSYTEVVVAYFVLLPLSASC